MYFKPLIYYSSNWDVSIIASEMAIHSAFKDNFLTGHAGTSSSPRIPATVVDLIGNFKGNTKVLKCKTDLQPASIISRAFSMRGLAVFQFSTFLYSRSTLYWYCTSLLSTLATSTKHYT